MEYAVKLKIAGIVIKMHSVFPVKQISKNKNDALRSGGRYENFLYKGKQKADVSIGVKIVKEFPKFPDLRPLFVTYHFQDNAENWRLSKNGDNFIYKSPLEGRKQLVFISKDFKKATAYLLKKGKGKENWAATEIIYDFLQVFLIHYLAIKKLGIILHAVGIRDSAAKGLVFTGVSGRGKSTLARLWSKHAKAIVLNDDRVIVRKFKNRFIIHGSPWHGDFNDYLKTQKESAILKKLFFINHARENSVERISAGEITLLIYPVIFLPFWDKVCLNNVISFSKELSKIIPSYKLGFSKNKRIIRFIRKSRI